MGVDLPILMRQVYPKEDYMKQVFNRVVTVMAYWCLHCHIFRKRALVWVDSHNIDGAPFDEMF